VGIRWNEWNLDHAGRHGVTPEEVEYIILRMRRPFPQGRGDGKFMVQGRTPDGAYAQVIYLLDADGTMYPIHARLLTDREKRKYRRNIK